MSETSASIKPSALRAPLALLGDGIIGRFTKIEDGIIGKFWGKIMMVAKILAMLLLISPAAADYVGWNIDYIDSAEFLVMETDMNDAGDPDQIHECCTKLISVDEWKAAHPRAEYPTVFDLYKRLHYANATKGQYSIDELKIIVGLGWGYNVSSEGVVTLTNGKYDLRNVACPYSTKQLY